MGCACSPNQPQQQDDPHYHEGHTSHHHGHTSHHAHGLEGDFPVWNTANTSANINPSSSLAVSNTFQLHSNPNAQHTIYLDFDGHTTSGTWWNNGGTIRSSAYNRDGNSASFSTSELLEIQSIWQQVAEDFAPFNVNVTTQDPGAAALSRTSSSDSQWGVRVLFTDNRNEIDGTAVAAGAGGIAYVGSFNRNVDQAVFVFNKGARAAAVTASHEVGHSLYLRHDGISGQTAYHPGHGSGATSWGTIMGAPFQENLTQWSKGDYYNADNTEDDLAIITTRNGFDYRSDDHGNSQANASALSLNNAGQMSSFGIIERNTDVDYFSFTIGAGDVSFTITPTSKAFVGNGSGGYATEYLDAQGANLDIWAGLYNSNGTLLTSSNPSNLLTASLDLSLTAGTYFIRIDGVGKDNPLVSGSQGYSDYGSLGQYSILGNVESLSARIIEASGSASLLTTVVGYQLQGQGAAAQFLRLNGNVVSENTFSGWSAIGVEQLGQGYQLLWKNVDGRYLDWRVDANGTYQSSQSISETELTSLEPTFQQDLNGDQEIGWASTAIETVGNASLTTTAVGYQLQGQGAAAQFLRLNGNVVSENTFSGWSAIGVEQLGQGYQLLWKNVDGRYLDWRVDANGTYQSSQSISETELTSLEPTFQQDLNGDQEIGWASTAIETVGNASLTTTAVGYQLQGQGAAAQFLRLNGNVVSENTFSGWSAIGVEQLGQGYQLLWKNVDGRYLDWRVDANGTYQSSQSISETELTSLEPTFQQDLNGDQEIGWASTAIETVGNASLTTTAVGYQLQGQGAAAQFLRLNGNVVSENTFSGWSAIGVEQLGQGYQLLWKNVDGRYLDWRVDANGTYQSSQSISETELTSLEPTFQQDLNGDQEIGWASTAIETVGNASLTTTAVGYQLQGQGAAAQFLRLNGNVVSENTFSGWSAIGVEQLGQGYQLLWKNVDGRYLDWRVDANGTYQSSQSISETELTSLEPTFQQDLNGDQEIGWASTAIETVGNASLTTTAVGYQLQGQGAAAQFLRLNGNVVSENTFSGWSAIGVEQLGQGYQLLWKNVDGRYLDWRVDANGTYQSSQSISETELTSLEPTFQQDLNGDQRIAQASLAHNLRYGDLLLGGPSDQMLVGNARNDLLIAEDSSDQFVFLNPTDGINTITVIPDKDLIQISVADFGRDLVGDVHLASEQFGLGVATTPDQESFLYDQLSGYLRYDADGIDGAASIYIATLS
ncbi:zinc-dependent metalloprotease family protein [Acaryochloris marina NIES-2412]|uniref:zinc-dependent metalloprotease family protein n=1 Tax=Acaryochloris marina TaxID=155978 RepID=UPI004058604E